MEIYIGKDGQVLGPYYPDEIQKRLDDGRLAGTELAWHEGLEAWVNVKELLEGKVEPAPEAKELSVETESAEEPEPSDEETLEQVEKIKELISYGHDDTALMLVRSLNNPRIYQGLLSGWWCEPYPGDGIGGIYMPHEFIGHEELFLKLLAGIPEGAMSEPEFNPITVLDLDGSYCYAPGGGTAPVYYNFCDLSAFANLTQLTRLHLNNNQINDLSPLKELTHLKSLHLSYNQISDVSPLANLTNLEWLTLDENQFSDVSPLANLTNLQWLTLGWWGGNPISDVSPLKELTQLKDLWFSICQISESDKQELQEALPGCDIRYGH